MRSILKKIRFKIVLVVNKKNKFMGTITNGDVREFIIRIGPK